MTPKAHDAKMSPPPPTCQIGLRSLSAHIDEMQALLTALKLRFDVIGVSETNEQAGRSLKNVTLTGYVLHSKYSNSSAGGVALYVN